MVLHMRFETANPWWVNDPDPAFSEWNARALKWTPGIVSSLVAAHLQRKYGLHFITGPRQVGKTTALHLFIHSLLQKGVEPHSICYFQCDEFSDFHELGDAIDAYLATRNARHISSSALVFDEITFVKEWWRAIKARLDAKQITNDTIIVTGSTSLDLLAQKEKFPGRRGDGIDAVILPLDFHQYASLYLPGLQATSLTRQVDVDAICDPNRAFSKRLVEIFQQYLVTGGFPTPIHDFHRSGSISQATYSGFLAWIKGDMQSVGKSMAFMKEIVQYLLVARNSSISWHSISKNTSIQSPSTVISYIELLENMFVIKTLYVLNQQQHIEYKRNKKVHLTDPFMFRAFSEYTGVDVLDEHIAESIVAAHLARKYPTYYWKNGSEIDAIAIIENIPVGFEVKYGLKQWKRVLHLAKQFVLDKPSLPLFLASVDWCP
jgi:predicted AAA+ superfamily ATPase